MKPFILNCCVNLSYNCSKQKFISVIKIHNTFSAFLFTKVEFILNIFINKCFLLSCFFHQQSCHIFKFGGKECSSITPLSFNNLILPKDELVRDIALDNASSSSLLPRFNLDISIPVSIKL